MRVFPNGYYNFLKHRKQKSDAEKAKVQKQIVEIYHSEDGVPGYRMMTYYLGKKKMQYSTTTIHKYMKELGLKSIVRRRKATYNKGESHHVFPNLLNRNFTVTKPNKIWCTDFTYLPQKDGSMRYNCTILDLYRRRVVATLNASEMTADLAIKTLAMAVGNHKVGRGLILHSDQGSQFTSIAFHDYCKSKHIQQSMSRAGNPLDNAPMERFYNTLKHEFYYLYQFQNSDILDEMMYDFINIKYNYIRPHSYNNAQPPMAA